MAEVAGTKQDLIKYPRASILCETNGKHDWLQTGELIQVGMAWRIIDAPIVGDGTTSDEAPSGNDPALQALLSKLGTLDGNALLIKSSSENIHAEPTAPKKANCLPGPKRDDPSLRPVKLTMYFPFNE